MAEFFEGVEWHEGYPKAQGWYDCFVAGNYCRLQHWICIMDRRHHWKRRDGSYETERVLWTGEPEARE